MPHLLLGVCGKNMFPQLCCLMNYSMNEFSLCCDRYVADPDEISDGEAVDGAAAPCYCGLPKASHPVKCCNLLRR